MQKDFDEIIDSRKTEKSFNFTFNEHKSSFFSRIKNSIFKPSNSIVFLLRFLSAYLVYNYADSLGISFLFNLSRSLLHYGLNIAATIPLISAMCDLFSWYKDAQNCQEDSLSIFSKKLLIGTSLIIFSSLFV